MGVERIAELSFTAEPVKPVRATSAQEKPAESVKLMDITENEVGKMEQAKENIRAVDSDEPEQTVQRYGAEKYRAVMAEKAVENANSRTRMMNTSAKFEYNEDINRITIKIQDKNTNEIVREIPSEDTQKMLEHIHTMRGLVVDKEV